MTGIRRWLPLAGPLLVPLLLAGALEWSARVLAPGSDALAPPSAAAMALAQMAVDGSLWTATGFTLRAALLGMALGGALGLLAGMLLGLSRSVAAASFLSIEILRPIPSVALIPMAMLVFGFGTGMEVGVVAFATLWPMLILLQAAVRQIEPRLLEVAAALELSLADRVLKILLPAVLPRFFVALRLCIAIALVVAVTVEIAANPHGVGYALIVAQQSLDPASMLAWLVWIGAVGLAVNQLAERLQRHALRRLGDFS